MRSLYYLSLFFFCFNASAYIKEIGPSMQKSYCLGEDEARKLVKKGLIKWEQNIAYGRITIDENRPDLFFIQTYYQNSNAGEVGIILFSSNGKLTTIKTGLKNKLGSTMPRKILSEKIIFKYIDQEFNSLEKKSCL